jgi:hypothetical protein
MRDSAAWKGLSQAFSRPNQDSRQGFWGAETCGYKFTVTTHPPLRAAATPTQGALFLLLEPLLERSDLDRACSPSNWTVRSHGKTFCAHAHKHHASGAQSAEQDGGGTPRQRVWETHVNVRLNRRDH